MINSGPAGQDFNVNNNVSVRVTNENTVDVQMLERNVAERIAREMGKVFDPVGDRIQNAILTAIDNNITATIEIAVRSIKTSSGRDGANVTAI